MNIHEHQAKKILKNYGAKVPNGIFASNVKDLLEKAKTLERCRVTIGTHTPSCN
mgnify:CR=1 FL=1